MRYRRLLEQLREQNWLAVAIDLVIVVGGVFIGMQVANWNEERLAGRKADAFTERLRTDLREEAWGYEMQVGYYTDVLAHGRRTLDAITGRAALSDEQLLIAAYRATQYNGNIRRRATYDELTSTGEIGLIREPALRDLAMSVYTAKMFDDIVDEGKQSHYRQWFRLNLPHEVQAAVSAACGDKIVVVGNYAGIGSSIDYPCSTGLSPEAIAAAAAILRADTEAVRLLRLRVADVETNLLNLTIYYRGMRDGLRATVGKAQ